MQDDPPRGVIDGFLALVEGRDEAGEEDPPAEDLVAPHEAGGPAQLEELAHVGHGEPPLRAGEEGLVVFGREEEREGDRGLDDGSDDRCVGRTADAHRGDPEGLDTEDECVRQRDVDGVAGDRRDHDDGRAVDAVEEIREPASGDGEEHAVDEDASVLHLKDRDALRDGEIEEAPHGGERLGHERGEGQENQDVGEQEEPEAVPHVRGAALGLAGAEVLGRERVDEREDAEKDRRGNERGDARVADGGEFVGPQLGGDELVDELHDGVGRHGDDRGDGDGEQLFEHAAGRFRELDVADWLFSRNIHRIDECSDPLDGSASSDSIMGDGSLVRSGSACPRVIGATPRFFAGLLINHSVEGVDSEFMAKCGLFLPAPQYPQLKTKAPTCQSNARSFSQ